MQHPPLAFKPMNKCYRLALFDLTKNQFLHSEKDLGMMAQYYALAHFKIREVKVAEETR
jgi:hypothetical protein